MFYFGIVLVLIVGSALAAPFVVNWNSWRNDLENYGHKLTGRDVAIDGNISARLFPWPRLEADEVSLANPKGVDGPATLQAKSITANFALAGLFSGQLLVESIDVASPVIAITRDKTGRGNWSFTPDQALRASGLLNKVQLDKINIKDGIVRLNDLSKNIALQFDHLNGLLSAAAMEGPWRAQATSQFQGVPLLLNASTAAAKPGEPLGVAVKITPQDGVTPSVAFDGSQQDGAVTGTLLVSPVESADGKVGLEGQFKPLQMQAKVMADFKSLSLDDIRIAPYDTKDTSTLVAGKAHFEYTDGLVAEIALNSPHVDLDSMAGAQSLRLWQAGGLMAVINSFMAEFPERMKLAAAFDVASLSAAGDRLENVHLVAEAETSAIRIKDFTADLPGRSRMKFSGLLFPGNAAAELGGTLAFESNDSRAFAQWLWPEGRQKLADVWTGARGRVKAQSDLTWNGKRFGFQNLNYELDGMPGKADVAITLGALPSFKLAVDAASLDLDSYLKGGLIPLLSDVGLAGLAGGDGAVEQHYIINTKQLFANGVTAQDVAAEIETGPAGLDLKNISIGSVGGAKFQGQGTVLTSGGAPTGTLDFSLQAPAPQDMLRLLGVLPAGPGAFWTKALGLTDMKGQIAVKPGEKEPAISFTLNGSSGALQLSGSGKVADVSSWPRSQVGFSVDVTTADDAALAQQLGYVASSPGAPAKASLTASGNSALGFKASLAMQGLGASLNYDGVMAPKAPWGGVMGSLKFDAPKASPLLQLFSVPEAETLKSGFAINAAVSSSAEQLKIQAISGAIGAAAIAGDASLDVAQHLSVNLSGGDYDLRYLLGAGLVEWRGQSLALDQSFASVPSMVKSAEIWLKPDHLAAGLNHNLNEAVVGLAFDDKGRSFNVAARSGDDEPFKLDLALAPATRGMTVKASAHAGFDIASLATMPGGQNFLTGAAVTDFDGAGEGRSPAAVLASLQGKVVMTVKNMSLAEVSPDGFFGALGTLKNADDLQAAFKTLRQPPGTVISDQTLSFTVKDGVATAPAIAVATPQAKIGADARFDFASQIFTLALSLVGNTQVDKPPLKITYGGTAGDFTAREDYGEFARKLGYDFIAKDMAELDRVKKEQERLAAEEAAQQVSDQEKFAAYQAQRGELRLRLREMKIQAAQREIDAARFKAEVDKSIQDNQVLARAERARLLRTLSQP